MSEIENTNAENEIEVNDGNKRKPFSFLKSKYVSEEEMLERKKKRKSITALSVLVMILAVGVMGNWYYQNTDVSATIEPLLNSAKEKTLGEAQLVNGTTTTKAENSYFSSARVERQNARDKSLEQLQLIVNNQNETKDAKNDASKKIAEISKYISIENKIETLVCAKGIENCVAVIDSDGHRVDVIVDAQDLNETLILQIKEIATSQLGCGFENVSIIQSK